MTFGERLIELRKERGFTNRNDFANYIGMPSTTLRNYETNVREPGHIFLKQMSDIFHVTIDYLLCMTNNRTSPAQLNSFSSVEADHIRKYRTLDDHGRESVDFILDKESKRVESLSAKDQRIAELEAELAPTTKEQAATIIELQPYRSSTFTSPYFRGGVSAGSGVFILGNEATDELEIPNIPKYEDTDYAVDVNGRSMEPDYMDGDIVLVSQGKEMHPGDIGIFIVDGAAFIKEMGRGELISRNKDFPNIPLCESSNIVCLGKVIGKLG